MARSENLKAELKVILSAAKEAEAARECLGILFPRLISELDLVVSSDQMDGRSRLRSRRLSQSDFSAAYFRLDPKPFTWSRSEIENLINSEDPFSAFEIFHEKISQAPPSERSRLRRIYLDILSSAFERDIRLTQAWLDAIVSNSADLIREYEAAGGIFSFSNADRLRALVVRALEPLGEEERTQLFMSSISVAADLTLLCETFRTIAGDLRADGVRPGRVGFGFGSGTDELREHLLSRVRNLATTGGIWSQARPSDLLWFWWGSGPDSEVQDFVSRAIEFPEGLNKMLEITIGRVSSSSGIFERVNHKSWPNIVDIARLEKAALSMISDSGDHDNRARADRFLEALKNGREEDW